MSQQPKNQRVQNFNHLTEALRRGRRRIRPEYVPELAAYLFMLSRRYERMYNAARLACKDNKDARLASTLEYINNTIATLQTITNGLCDGFDGLAWTDATDTVSEQMGIRIGEPLPGDMQTDGRVTLPPVGDK